MSSRTARHFFPSAFRVKLTPSTPLPLLPMPETSPPAVPVRVAEPPTVLPLRSAEGAMEPPVDGFGAEGPATVLPVAGSAMLPVTEPVAVPSVETGGCGAAAAVCGVEPFPVPVDDVLTEVGAVVVGVVVLLFVSDFTTLDPPG